MRPADVTPAASGVLDKDCRSVASIAAEIREQIRLKIPRTRKFGWSVFVGSCTDDELGAVIELLARRGFRSTYVREFGQIAHFDLEW